MSARGAGESAGGRRGRVLVLSPWGLRGGYSGPVTFLNRLFEAVHEADPQLAIDVLYHDRGAESAVGWARQATAVTRDAGFGLRAQLRWGLRAARLVRAAVREDATGGAGDTVVHLHGLYLANLIPALTLPPGRVVLLPVLENGDLDPAGPGPVAAVKTWMLRRVARMARVGFALSRGIRAEFTRLGMPDERVILLGNAVSEDEFASTARRPPRPGRLRLGFVGKLGPVKQPHLVLDAVARLRADGVEASAVFVGPFVGPDYERRFRARVDELGLEGHVTIAGMRDDVASVLLGEMDVFVLPSAAEGMPGALAEAMMTGLPAIVTGVGAMGDVITTSGGGAVVEADGTQIAGAAARMLHDGVWAECSVRAAAYARAEFGGRGVAARYLDAAGLRTAASNAAAASPPASTPAEAAHPTEELTT